MKLTQETHTQAALALALRRAGLCPGDTVFFHVSREAVDAVEPASSGQTVNSSILAALHDAVGEQGSILLPAYSLSFWNQEPFDRDESPVVEDGHDLPVEFLEYFRRLPGVVRSADPLYSMMGIGPAAEELLGELPNSSFGKDCVYERLLNCSAKLCVIGGSLADTPFLHYIEEAAGVPFRYKKLFTGRIRQHGEWKKQGWITSVAIQAPNAATNRIRVDEIVQATGSVQAAAVGSSDVQVINFRAFYDCIRQEVARDPWITAVGPAECPIQLEQARVGASAIVATLPENASMEQMIASLWQLPRDIVSDGYDAALDALSTQAPMTVHEYPSGAECWTWLAPEKWTCKEAWLETLAGRRIFSYSDNPLHVVSYSLPIDREVTREELFAHLHVHAELPGAIPFIFKYYERDWGLCCSRQLKDSLNDPRYRVVIRSEFSYGTLKVGEITVPGTGSRSFVLCSHLCHPGMVNDDLSGVVVGMKVMQELRKRRNLRYTYRFLILPETIGSVAYLSHNPQLIPQMAGGLFLEMLGLENPHALQLSFAGDTEMDRRLTETLRECDPSGWTGAFRTVVGNDERQFNAPGVRVPMLSLSRVLPHRPGAWPYYPQYHSSRDTPELASIARLEESRDLVLKMIDAIESNEVPINLFRGEVFCSRYGLHIDPYSNPEGNRALFDILFLVDGTRSVGEIARTCGISIETARSVLHELEVRDLIAYAPLVRRHCE